MSAAFPTSVKTFTSRSAGQAIASAHINDLQDEVNAVETTLLPIAGGQVAFPATQNPSANANTLDDYEEGTWTPSLGGTTTYAFRTGVYTKIGRQVNLHAGISVTLIGTGSVGLVTGLPFTPTTVYAGSVGLFTSAASNLVFASCFVDSTPQLVITGLTAAGASLSQPCSMFGNGTVCYFSVTYYV